MIHIQTQKFYEKQTGNAHEVTILFGGISPVSNGMYEVDIDGEWDSYHKRKHGAFNRITYLIKENDWSPVNHN